MSHTLAHRWARALEVMAVVYAGSRLFLPGISEQPAVTVTLALGMYFVVRALRLKSAPAPKIFTVPFLLAFFFLVPVTILLSPLSTELLLSGLGMVWFSAALFLEITSAAPREPRGDLPAFPGPILLRVLVIAIVLTAVGVLVMQRPAKFPILPDLLGSISGALPQCADSAIPAAWVGGAAAVFLPIAMAAAAVLLPTRNGAISSFPLRGLFFVCVACVAVLIISLALSQSRTAILASAAGLAALGLLSGPRGRVAVGGAIAAVMLLIFVLPDAVLTPFLFAGKLSGLSLETLFTGRTEIWGRAVFALRDFPWTGLGPASVSSAFLVLYPCSFTPSGWVAHAHNMPLQVALDIGIPGAFLFASASLFFFLALIALHPCERAAHLERAGFIGAFTALFLFGIAEAFPLGSPPSAVLSVLYALAFRTVTAGGVFSSRPRLSKKIVRYTLITGALLLCVLLFDLLFPGASPLQGSFQTNTCNIKLARTILSPLHSERADTICRKGRASLWLKGKAFEVQRDSSRRDSCWVAAIRSDPTIIALAYTADPSNRFLAESAYAMYHSRALACFWLAEAVAEGDTSRAISLYRTGLRSKPYNGLAWKKLGDLLVRSDPRGALGAYVKACLHGDPGANGCLLAGRIAEKLGDINSAVRYYRMSRYSEAHRRADELELSSP